MDLKRQGKAPGMSDGASTFREDRVGRIRCPIGKACGGNSNLMMSVAKQTPWTGHANHGGGLNRSGVDPPLSSSRACLTTFIANSVP